MLQSIDRAMSIIELFHSDPAKHSWSVTEISGTLKLPLSTTHRLISSLMKYDLLAQVDETKKYYLGSRWMEIGLLQLEGMDLRTVSKPVMKALAHEVKESVYLSIPNGLYAFAIERIDSPLKMRLVENLGEQIPMHIGAPNKVMLAHMQTERAYSIVSRLIRNNEEKAAFMQLLEGVKGQGYSMSYGEKTEGTASLAVPIMGFGGEVMGALSIGMLIHDAREERLTYLVEEISKSATDISEKIGGK